jgi:hypothetical protein
MSGVGDGSPLVTAPRMVYVRSGVFTLMPPGVLIAFMRGSYVVGRDKEMS